MQPATEIEFTRIPVTAEQYVAALGSPGMQEVRDGVTQALLGAPDALKMFVIRLCSTVATGVVDALLECNAEEVEAELRRRYPEVSADFDAGLSALESARKRAVKGKAAAAGGN